MKKIILIIVLLLGSYYFYSNDNSDKKVIEKIDIFSDVIIDNNIVENKTENINIEKEVKVIKDENIISNEKLEDNISDIEKTETEILVYSENNDFFDKNESILNTNTDFIDEEELEIEIDSMLSDFLYEFSEKEGLDIDDFSDIFGLNY